MIIFKIIIGLLGGLGLLGTLASRLRFSDWWIRAFDFPRVQLTVMMLLALAGGMPFFDATQPFHWIALGALLLAIAFQAYKIWPYTPLAQQDVRRAEHPTGDNVIRLLEANVLMDNEQRAPLLSLIHEHEPDLVLLMETNQEWEDDLSEIEADYPHRVYVPLENKYGMHLYSRLELIDPEVRYLIQDDIPSIRTRVRLRNDEEILLYCVHPMPPSPTEAYASTGRDGELLMVGKEVKDKAEPVLIAGDLNDVAWSHSTRLFRRVSELLDPRRGRGFYSTFHADYWLARWPLDHFFHSDHFTLVALERQHNIGSDHFPVLLTLAYEPRKSDEQQEPDATEQEEENATEMVQSAIFNRPDTVRDKLDM